MGYESIADCRLFLFRAFRFRVSVAKIQTKHLSLVKAIILVFKAGACSLLVGYNI